MLSVSFLTDHEVNMNFDDSDFLHSIPGVTTIQYRRTNIKLRLSDSVYRENNKDIVIITIGKSPELRKLYDVIQPFSNAVKIMLIMKFAVIRFKNLSVEVKKYGRGK